MGKSRFCNSRIIRNFTNQALIVSVIKSERLRQPGNVLQSKNVYLSSFFFFFYSLDKKNFWKHKTLTSVLFFNSQNLIKLEILENKSYPELISEIRLSLSIRFIKKKKKNPVWPEKVLRDIPTTDFRFIFYLSPPLLPF